MKRTLPILLLVIGAVCYFLFRPEEYLYRPGEDDDLEEDGYEDNGYEDDGGALIRMRSAMADVECR